MEDYGEEEEMEGEEEEEGEGEEEEGTDFAEEQLLRQGLMEGGMPDELRGMNPAEAEAYLLQQ
jgi:hypothetical protein